MKHVEDAFGVSLFIRGKNKLCLNETGLKAVEYAKALLADEENAIAMVQAYDNLTSNDINGFNCLLRDDIGFWSELCRRNMPASKFLVQTNDFELEELIKNSTMLYFTTNLASPSDNLFKNRKIIPITDEDANVIYHLIYKKSMKFL